MKLKIKRLEIQQRVSLELLAENGLPIAEAATQVAARLRQRLPTILIVDGEESIRMVISKALEITMLSRPPTARRGCKGFRSTRSI